LHVHETASDLPDLDLALLENRPLTAASLADS
jgi:hypothetical protein